jgi:ubiquinone/menaquinone biosynthesis C-methylase UbiE
MLKIILTKTFRRMCEKRANNSYNEIKEYLCKGDKILDIGSGTCNICQILKNNSYDCTPVDIENKSILSNIAPIIYDGKKLPFKDRSYDVALLLTVLHHTPNPETILKEAKRVAKRIIIIEDVYLNIFHKYLTFFIDSLLNFEFSKHPHSNKKDAEWKNPFNKLGLSLIDVKKNRCFLIVIQRRYYLNS